MVFKNVLSNRNMRLIVIFMLVVFALETFGVQLASTVLDFQIFRQVNVRMVAAVIGLIGANRLRNKEI